MVSTGTEAVAGRGATVGGDGASKPIVRLAMAPAAQPMRSRRSFDRDWRLTGWWLFEEWRYNCRECPDPIPSLSARFSEGFPWCQPLKFTDKYCCWKLCGARWRLRRRGNP